MNITVAPSVKIPDPFKGEPVPLIVEQIEDSIPPSKAFIFRSLHDYSAIPLNDFWFSW